MIFTHPSDPYPPDYGYYDRDEAEDILGLDPLTICQQARTEILDTYPFDVDAYRCINVIISHVLGIGRTGSSVDPIFYRS
jgi:hypothetical protein